MSFYPGEWFPPAARLNEYIAIVQGPGEVSYGRVEWFEPIPVYSVRFTLKAGETLSDQELEKIEVGEMEVLQMRIAVKGAAKFQFKLPRAVTRFTLRRDSGWIDENIAGYPKFPPQTEVHILEDTHLFTTISNLNPNHAEAAKIYITGWRLVFTPVERKPENYSSIIIQGFAPRTNIGTSGVR